MVVVARMVVFGQITLRYCADVPADHDVHDLVLAVTTFH